MKQSTNIKSAYQIAAIAALSLFFAVSCTDSKKSDNNESMTDKNEVVKEAYSEADLNFLKDVTEINQKEILLGKLAQEKAMSGDVKDLGKMMEESHRKCEGDLKDLTDKKSINLMAVSTDNAMDAHKKLNEKSGKDFDKEYCDMMVKGHKDAIEKFEKASTDANDLDIRTFATNTLPELHKHLEHAQMCKEKSDKMK